MTKQIKVSKISKESFNKLMDLGYDVRIVQVTDKPSVHAKYVYEKTVRPVESFRLPKEDKVINTCRICHKINCINCQ